MLTNRIKEIINSEAIVGAYGTRDSNNIPKVGSQLYIGLAEDDNKITFLVHQSEFEEHKANLEENGRLALTFTSVPSHESYQIKGRYSGVKEASNVIKQSAAAKFLVFMDVLKSIGYPGDLVDKMNHYALEPSVVVELEIQEIFEQTPKPGTGKKI